MRTCQLLLVLVTLAAPASANVTYYFASGYNRPDPDGCRRVVVEADTYRVSVNLSRPALDGWQARQGSRFGGSLFGKAGSAGLAVEAVASDGRLYSSRWGNGDQVLEGEGPLAKYATMMKCRQAGRFFHWLDFETLPLAAEDGTPLVGLEVRLRLYCWEDRLFVEAVLTPTADLSGVRARLVWRGIPLAQAGFREAGALPADRALVWRASTACAGLLAPARRGTRRVLLAPPDRVVHEVDLPEPWSRGRSVSCYAEVLVSPGSDLQRTRQAADEDLHPLDAGALRITASSPGEPRVEAHTAGVLGFDATRGHYTVRVPATPTLGYYAWDPNQYDWVTFLVRNDSRPRTFRLKTVNFGASVWGGVVIRGSTGLPCGIAAQQCSQWDQGPGASDFHATYTCVPLRPHEVQRLTHTTVYQNWGEKPITRMQSQDLYSYDRWGQLWLQTSNGQGEHICYNWVQHAYSPLTDCRPFGGRHIGDVWDSPWNENVGGQSFLKYCTFAPGATPWKESGPNLLSNAGFEAQGAEGAAAALGWERGQWEGMALEAGYPYAQRSTERAHTGRWSARIMPRTDSRHSVWAQTVLLEPHQRYTVSAWVGTGARVPGAALNLVLVDARSNVAYMDWWKPTRPGLWRRLRLGFRTGAANRPDSKVQLRLLLAVGPAQVPHPAPIYFDDVLLTRGGATPSDWHLLECRGVHYTRHSVNLTQFVVHGLSGDSCVASRIEVSQFPAWECTRAFYRVRYDVRRRVHVGDVRRYLRALCLGDEGYGLTTYPRLAYSDANGRLRVVALPRPSEDEFDLVGVPLGGPAPFAYAYGFRDGSRGFVVRRWAARVGGRSVARPALTVLREGGRMALVPDSAAPALLAGDWMEFEAEFLFEGVNTDGWSPIVREQQAFRWPPSHTRAHRGSVVRAFPPVIRADSTGTAEFTFLGGRDYASVSVTGLKRPAASSGGAPWVQERVRGTWVPVDQSVASRHDWWDAEREEDGSFTLLYALRAGGVRRYRVSIEAPAQAERRARRRPAWDAVLAPVCIPPMASWGRPLVANVTAWNTGRRVWGRGCRVEPVGVDSAQGGVTLVRSVPPGGRVVLKVPVSVPRKRGLHVLAWRMVGPAGPFGSIGFGRTFVHVHTHDAEFLRIEAPARLAPGERAVLRVVVRNGGELAWRGGGDRPFRLRVFGPGEPPPQGAANLPDGISVAPGQSYAFSAEITAPGTPGRYYVRLQMVQEGVCYFGRPLEYPIEVRR